MGSTRTIIALSLSAAALAAARHTVATAVISVAPARATSGSRDPAPRQISHISHDEPMYAPDGRTILYVDDVDGPANIFVMDTAGRHVTRLTHHALHDDGPVWSPDGSKIAFSGEDLVTKVVEIYVMRGDGSDIRQLTRDRATNVHPMWSPDSRRLMYSSTVDSPDQKNPQVWETYMIDADGKHRRRITRDGGVNTYATWSPDGSHILFRKKIDDLRNSEVFLMDTSGTNLVNLSKDPGYDRYPLFSPDGNRIVFESNRAGHSQLLLMNADGSGVRVLVDGPGQLSAPRFSPDGRRVIYPRDLDGEIKIFEVTLP